MYNEKKHAAKGNLYKLSVGIIVALQFFLFVGFKTDVNQFIPFVNNYLTAFYIYIIKLNTIVIYNILVVLEKLHLINFFENTINLYNNLLFIINNNHFFNINYFLVNKSIALFYLVIMCSLLILYFLFKQVIKFFINVFFVNNAANTKKTTYKTLNHLINSINNINTTDLIRLKANFDKYVEKYGTNDLIFLNKNADFYNSNVYFGYIFENTDKKINLIKFRNLFNNSNLYLFLKSLRANKKNTQIKKYIEVYKKIRSGEVLYEL
jgi:hypothetical protein